MSQKIAIFASGDVDNLLNRLKIGFPKPTQLRVISGDIVTQEIKDKIKEGTPHQFDHNVALRRERLPFEEMQSSAELVIVNTTTSQEFLAIYKRAADMYSDSRTIIELEVTNGLGKSDTTKQLFLISGDHYEIMNKIISTEPPEEILTEEEKEKAKKPAEKPINISITAETTEDLEEKAIAIINNKVDLITLNTSASNDESNAFLTRLGERTGFEVIKVKTPSKATIIEKEKTTETVSELPKEDTLEEKIEKLATKHGLTKAQTERFADYAIEILSIELRMEEGMLELHKKFVKKVLTKSVTSSLITAEDEIRLKIELKIKP